ncbi:tetratricopeptide repeat protein [bacterium]|nr:tetratricopeptide repeat protein [bacterium]
MKIRSALLLLVIISLVSSTGLLAQSGAAKGKGRIKGKVTDASGAPLAGVTVRFESERLQTSFDTKTKDDGSFTVIGIKGGAWNVDFLKEGFKDRKISTQVSELSYNAPIEIQLEKAVVEGQAAPKEKVPGLDLVQEGNNLKAAKDYAGAIAKYQAALAANPSLVEVYGDIARIHAEQGNHAEAVASYKKLLAAKPDNQEAKLEMASLLLQQKNPDEAKTILSGVDLSTSINPYTLYNLGVGFYNLQQADEAIKYWDKAVTLDPKMVDAWLQLGFAYYSVGNMDKAKQALQKVIELEPGSDNAKSAQEFLSSM